MYLFTLHTTQNKQFAQFFHTKKFVPLAFAQEQKKREGGKRTVIE